MRQERRAIVRPGGSGRRLAVAGAVLAPVALYAANMAPRVCWTPYGRRFFPAVQRLRVPDAVALTFDDGPDPASLDAFLEAFDRLGARATFFVLGEQVEAWPDGPARIVAAGHEVGVHGYRHGNHYRMFPWQVIRDLRRAGDVIGTASPGPLTLFRPPSAAFSAATWWESRRHGWMPVIWSRLGNDWDASATPESIAGRVGGLSPGDVILLHDSDRYSAPGSWRRTLAALPTIAARAEAAGLAMRGVGELLAREHHDRRAPAARHEGRAR